MRWPLPWPKAWRSEEPASAPAEEEPKSFRRSVILFARDLAVAFLIVGIVMGLLWGYTGNWPPMVVIESDSMQHGDRVSFVGVIDTGDLVLVQRVGVPADVTTYVDALASGHETYSNQGDVIVFHYTSQSLDATPIIHRAMVYVVYPSVTGSGVDVPSLEAVPGRWTGDVNGMQTSSPYGLSNFTLLDVRSWHTGDETTRDISFKVDGVEAPGFLTKGDHNGQPDSWGPVPVGRIIGKARGELPWFGLLKLSFAPGGSGCCPAGWGDSRAPSNSWDSLLISLVLIIAGPFSADFLYGYWKENRKEKGKEAEEGGVSDPATDEGPTSPTSGDSPPPSPVGDGVAQETATDAPRTKSAEPEGDAP